MVHDLRGHELKVGDTVYIPCTVVRLNPGGDGQNLGLETELGTPAEAGAKTRLSVHAAQVVFGTAPQAVPRPAAPAVEHVGPVAGTDRAADVANSARTQADHAATHPHGTPVVTVPQVIARLQDPAPLTPAEQREIKAAVPSELRTLDREKLLAALVDLQHKSA
jgi:hypothetical protein